MSLVGAAIAGGLLGIGGSIISGKQNERTSARSAADQMAFQQKMSSTAHQRAAKDLEAAGLNRILAAGSPASSPGGASYQGQIPDLGASMNSGLSAAMMMEKAPSEIGALEAGITESSARTADTKAATAIKDVAKGKLEAEKRSSEAAAAKDEMFTKFYEEMKPFMDEAFKSIPDVVNSAKKLIEEWGPQGFFNMMIDQSSMYGNSAIQMDKIPDEFGNLGRQMGEQSRQWLERQYNDWLDGRRRAGQGRDSGR